MFMNLSKLIFFFFLFLGSMISISSNSWLGIWMGLEINLLSFIPLMIESNNMMSSEASLKYFLTQALASSVLLFFIMLFFMMNNLSFFYMELHNFNMIFIPLMIKSGMAPFHFWFPNVMEGINWMSGLLLMTWQKIAPLTIISYLINYNYFILIIILSTLIGAIGGLNQTSLRKILAFSSINHLGWMLSTMLFNEHLWFSYFLIYSFISISLIFLFYNFNLFFLNQIFSKFIYSPILKFISMISLLSLAGLPPFLGFLPKWITIQSLTTLNQNFLILIMICGSLITMYFYLRITYSAFILNYEELLWNFNMNLNKKIILNMVTIFISINSLFIILNFMFFMY